MRTDATSNEPNISGEAETGTSDNRGKLLQTYQQRHGFLPPPIGKQHPEHALTLLINLQARKSPEFPPLSRISNSPACRGVEIESVKI